MKKKRFRCSGFVGILKQAEVGVPVGDLVRKAEGKNLEVQGAAVWK